MAKHDRNKGLSELTHDLYLRARELIHQAAARGCCAAFVFDGETAKTLERMKW